MKRFMLRFRRRYQTGPHKRVTVVVTEQYRLAGGTSESINALVAAYTEAFEKAKREESSR